MLSREKMKIATKFKLSLLWNMTDIKNSVSVTYQMLGKAKDATFELMDSVMTTRNASCMVVGR
jgi:hypothetical protein